MTSSDSFPKKPTTDQQRLSPQKKTAIWQKLQHQAERSLHPSFFSVLMQLVPLHLVAGGVTLFFCPQFNVSPWALFTSQPNTLTNLGNSAMDVSSHMQHQLNSAAGARYFFSQLGPQACEFLCGLFFFGLTILAARFLLNVYQRQTMKKYAFAYSQVLIFLSYMTFHLMNPHYVGENLFFWWLGSFVIFYGPTKTRMYAANIFNPAR